MRALLALLLVGCCPSPPVVHDPPAPKPPAPEPPAPEPPAPEPPRFTFIDDYNFPPGTTFEGLPFGGISAIAYDGERVIALSDAHKKNAPARTYELAIDIQGSEMSVAITGMTRLGGAFEGGLLDPEGLARVSAGRWLISTEGDGAHIPRLPPALYEVDERGAVLAKHALPDDFSPTPSGELTHGVTHNKGIEGLTASPSGNVFFAINETPLAQDGEVATFEHGGKLRLLQLDRSFAVQREYVYLTEPVPRLATGNVERALNGVSALCAIADDRLLVMERAAVRVDGTYHNRIQVFELQLPRATKQLVLDLDDHKARFEPGYRKLDNFEGMALGPNGTLLLVSDDNFKDVQRTAILAFSLSVQ